MHSINKFLLWVALFLAAPAAWADGVLTPAAGPFGAEDCHYTRWICIEDDFLGGGTGTHTIGQLGWSALGGVASTVPASEANRMGLIQRSTGASSGQYAYLFIPSTQAGLIAGTAYLHYEPRLNSIDADTTARVGALYLVNTAPTDGTYFERLLTDTNWFCVTRAASTQTRTDTGIAAAANFLSMDIDRTLNTSVEFKLNGVTVCTHTTNIPTAQALTIGLQVYNNSANAAKTIDLDYFKGRIAVTR